MTLATNTLSKWGLKKYKWEIQFFTHGLLANGLEVTEEATKQRN